MGCGGNKVINSCITNTLLAIAEEQDKVIDSGHCSSGCGTALDELRGCNEPVSKFNTVPFMLTCNNSCGELFVGTGGFRNNLNERDIGISCVFRVTNVDPATNCATLELLQHESADTSRSDLLLYAQTTLKRTGVCITVDLDNFSSISCLPAVNLTVTP